MNMKTFNFTLKTACALVFALCVALCPSAQVVVGSYSCANGKSYQILVDGQRFRVPLNQLSSSEKKNIYLQMEVETKTPGVFTYLRLKKGDVMKLINKISSCYVKGQKMMQSAKKQRAVIGKGCVFISFVRADSNISTNPVFGWNQSNKYSIVYERGYTNPLVTFEGSPSGSEGDIPFNIAGWTLTISSPEQANDLIQLLMSGVHMMEKIKKEQK